MENRFLFKAKRLGWREFPEKEQWITGYYVLGFNEYEQPVHLIFEPTSMFFSHGETDGWIEIDPSTICRCTGLNDKNGNLIWENDIINNKCGKAVVVCDKAGWQIEWIKDIIWRKDLYFWVNERQCEVIGNKIDNPELLESEVGNDK